MLNAIKNQIKALETKAYNLKTKAAKTKAYDKVHELRRQAWDILHDQIKSYGPQSMQATVKSFHSGNDQFLVETPYGTLWVSPTADVQSKSWYEHTCCIEYTVGQTIVIEFETEVNMEYLYLQLIPGKMYGGIVNETQYAELCKRDDLAFFKYPNSDGVTGLFKQSKAV